MGSECRLAGRQVGMALLDFKAASAPAQVTRLIRTQAALGMAVMADRPPTHLRRKGGAAPPGRRATLASWWPSQRPRGPPSAGSAAQQWRRLLRRRQLVLALGQSQRWLHRPVAASFVLCPAPSPLASATDLRSRCCGLVPPGSGAREVGRMSGAATVGIATAGRGRRVQTA